MSKARAPGVVFKKFIVPALAGEVTVSGKSVDIVERSEIFRACTTSSPENLRVDAGCIDFVP